MILNAKQPPFVQSAYIKKLENIEDNVGCKLFYLHLCMVIEKINNTIDFMKRIFGLLMMLVLVAGLTTSCKSKQKVVNITGADIEAVDNRTEPAPVVQKEEVIEKPEVTRGESFHLAEGEEITSTFNRKYHVVVGSFGVRDNAKRLQSTLIGEGNDALMVINEQGMYRVIVSSYDDYSQARNRISQLSSRFPDAWVLRQK